MNDHFCVDLDSWFALHIESKPTYSEIWYRHQTPVQDVSKGFLMIEKMKKCDSSWAQTSYDYRLIKETASGIEILIR